jgi:hypothetical protein
LWIGSFYGSMPRLPFRFILISSPPPSPVNDENCKCLLWSIL